MVFYSNEHQKANARLLVTYSNYVLCTYKLVYGLKTFNTKYLFFIYKTFIRIKGEEAQTPTTNLVCGTKCNILERVVFTIEMVFMAKF